jgi:hypothetical protein
MGKNTVWVGLRYGWMHEAVVAITMTLMTYRKNDSLDNKNYQQLKRYSGGLRPNGASWEVYVLMDHVRTLL